MVTRVGGLASGMDIDSIVEKLMSAEKAPLNKLYQQQQKYEWQRDAYREINTALNTFDNYLFDNFRLSSNFYKKTVTSTNDSLVAATATSAAAGSLSIEGVSQLATSWQGVGKQIDATSSTKMSSLGLDGSTTLSIKAIQSDGTIASKAIDIKINGSDTINDVIKRINSSGAGVTAIFENGKLSVTANSTGATAEGKSVEFTAGTEVLNALGFDQNSTDTTITQAKNAVFQINGISTERTSNSFTLNGYNVTLKSTFNTNETISNYKEASQKNYENAINNLKNNYGINTDTTHEDIMAQLETKLSEAKTALTDAQSILTSAKSEVFLPENLKNIYENLDTETKTFLSGLNEDQINNLVNVGWDSSAVDTTLFSDAEKATLQSLSSDDITALKDLDAESLNQIKSPKTAGGVYSSISSNSRAFLGGLTAEQQQELSSLDLENLEETLPAGSSFTEEQWKSLKSLSEADRKTLNGLSNEELTLVNNVKIAEDDVSTKKSELTALNNATTQYINAKETNDNAQSMSGVPGETTVAPVTLTSSTDTDSMVDKIKEFVETYNGIVETINSKLKEKYNRDYPPLTDEQKEDMSEDEIEKWEAKAKTGLLRNDSILTNGIYDMRRTFMDAVGGLGDETINSLAEIGITTSSNTSDGGKLVIDENKLRAAIEKNSDQVASIFTKTGSVTKDSETGKTVDTRGIAQRLRDGLTEFTTEIEKKAGKTSSTNQSFTIGKRMDEIEDSITRWLDKLENIESRYWRQFTAMEQAISNANSQASLFQTA